VVKSSWLQIQRPGLDSRRYQVFWEVLCLERGPLNLVSTSEEKRKTSGSSLENRDCGHRADCAAPYYPQKLALTSPRNGGRWVGIVRSRTQATEFVLCTKANTFEIFLPIQLSAVAAAKSHVSNRWQHNLILTKPRLRTILVSCAIAKWRIWRFRYVLIVRWCFMQRNILIVQ
jgi:hypothetical protein